LIRRTVAEAGFELVDVGFAGSDRRPLLRVKADLRGSRPGHGIGVDDCARLSRVLERALEADGHVGPRYVLEVSSPGLERPVRFPEHWRRFVGRRVAVKTSRWAGRQPATIVAVPDEARVTLCREGEDEVTLDLDEIEEATLVVDWKTLGKR
jgi:ribosome maturation factor RimP